MIPTLPLRRWLVAAAIVAGACGAACIIGPKQDDPAPAAPMQAGDDGALSLDSGTLSPEAGALDGATASDTGKSSSDTGALDFGACGVDGGASDAHADGGCDAGTDADAGDAGGAGDGGGDVAPIDAGEGG